MPAIVAFHRRTFQETLLGQEAKGDDPIIVSRALAGPLSQ